MSHYDNEAEMKELIESLQKAMSEKNLSPEQAAGYIGCTGIAIRRWIKGVHAPSPVYRAAIRVGIEKIKQEAI